MPLLRLIAKAVAVGQAAAQKFEGLVLQEKMRMWHSAGHGGCTEKGQPLVGCEFCEEEALAARRRDGQKNKT